MAYLPDFGGRFDPQGILANLVGGPQGLLNQPAAPPSWGVQPMQAGVQAPPDPTITASMPATPAKTGFGGFMDRNSGAMAQLGASLLAAPTLREGLAGFGQVAPQAIERDKRRVAVTNWAKAGFPRDMKDPAAAAVIAAAPDLGEKYFASSMVPETTDDIREFEYDKRNGFGGTFHEWMTQKKASGGNAFGNTPIYLKNKDGKLGIGRFNDEGGMTVVDTQGYEVADPVSYIDTGLTQVPTTRRGGTEGAAAAGIAPVAKDPAGVARETKVGANEGEAITAWRSMESKMPGVETVVKQLDDLSNKATYTEGGKLIDAAMRQADMEPRESAVARAQYISTVDNQILPLLRDTFGAAFTQKEGDTLRATLGDPDKAPSEKQAILKSFIEQKRRDVRALAAQAGKTEPAADEGWREFDTPSGPLKIRVKPQ